MGRHEYRSKEMGARYVNSYFWKQLLSENLISKRSVIKVCSAEQKEGLNVRAIGGENQSFWSASEQVQAP